MVSRLLTDCVMWDPPFVYIANIGYFGGSGKGFVTVRQVAHRGLTYRNSYDKLAKTTIRSAIYELIVTHSGRR